MTDTMKAAYITAQAAMLNAEIAQMQAENQCRIARGNMPIYDEFDFERVIGKYTVLAHNDVITYLTT